MQLWKVDYSIGAFLALVLFLLDKSGKNNTAVTIFFLILITISGLHAALQWPWIWETTLMPEKMWRIWFVSALVITIVGRFGVWIWPESTAQKQPMLHQTEQPKSPATKETPKIVMQLPPVGNLKERAINLSEEIMEDLYMRGYKQYAHPGTPHIGVLMPTTPKEVEQWARRRASYFRFRFFDRVVNIRNEFAQLLFLDERLDDFIKHENTIKDANKQSAVAGQPQIDSPLLPQMIEDIAERLKKLADHL